MRTGRITGLILISAFLIYSPCHAISIGFNQLEYNIEMGGSFTAGLIVADLGNMSAPSIGTFDINVDFDPTVLNLTSVIYGDQLDLFGFGSIQDTTQTAGSANLFELSFDLADDLDFFQADSFILASLSFDGLLSGNSPLDIIPNYIGDSLGTPLFANQIIGATTNVSDVAPVPEPSTILLISTGLAGLGYYRRKIKH